MLSALSLLETISLVNNRLTGLIPHEYGRMTSLKTLRVSQNRLRGQLYPRFIALEAPLEVLDVSGNQLTGTLSELVELKTNLRSLLISDNFIVGSLPVTLFKLVELEVLQVANNRLSGTIPTELGIMTRLSSLWLQGNIVSGTIPTEIQLLTLLTDLRLQSNELVGTVHDGLSRLQFLRVLTLGENRLAGTIPDFVYTLTNLRLLDLSHLDLKGPISGPGLSNLTNLVGFLVEDNQLTGDIPTELFSLPLLKNVTLNFNWFSEGIPVPVSCESPVPALEMLQADCLPSDDPPNPCPCCTHCCDREGRINCEPQEQHQAQSDMPSPVPNSQDMLNFLEDYFGENVFIEGTSHALAADWIMNNDIPVDVASRPIEFIQRYVLILFYFQTSFNGEMPWDYCNPFHVGMGNSKDVGVGEVYCNYTDPVSGNVTSAARWLSEVSVCWWLGVTCTDGLVSHIALGKLLW